MKIFKISDCCEMPINRFIAVTSSIGLPFMNDPVVLKMKKRDIFPLGNPNTPTL
jgi:hypothetical protein